MIPRKTVWPSKSRGGGPFFLDTERIPYWPTLPVYLRFDKMVGIFFVHKVFLDNGVNFYQFVQQQPELIKIRCVMVRHCVPV